MEEIAKPRNLLQESLKLDFYEKIHHGLDNRSVLSTSQVLRKCLMYRRKYLWPCSTPLGLGKPATHIEYGFRCLVNRRISHPFPAASRPWLARWQAGKMENKRFMLAWPSSLLIEVSASWETKLFQFPSSDFLHTSFPFSCSMQDYGVLKCFLMNDKYSNRKGMLTLWGLQLP